MSQQGIKVVMGGASGLRDKPCPDAPKLLSILQKHKVSTIDTAVIYGSSEENLGDHKAGDTFIIDTKLPGGFKQGHSSRDQVVEMGRGSLERLKVKQVDILYIHSPDPTVPFEQTLEGLNQLHQEGAFRRLGLSNFTPDEVQQVLDICAQKGFVEPSVYQGNYNAFARSYETSLMPLLRKSGMSFYAYSPQAGGFLSKTHEIVNAGKGEGRIAAEGPVGDLYRALYKKPALLEGLRKWNEIADGAGLKPSDMAVRWVRFNSALKNENGDAIIIGGRTNEQVDQSLTVLEEGPLSEDVARKIDEVWETVKADAPVDNYHDFVAKNQK